MGQRWGAGFNIGLRSNDPCPLHILMQFGGFFFAEFVCSCKQGIIREMTLKLAKISALL